MAEASSATVALISIHPRFAEAILDGLKRVEFRKVPFKRALTHVVLYATCPVQRIVGVVEVVGIDQCPPAELWRRYRAVGGIGRNDFFAYFDGRSHGYAVQVRHPRRLKRAVRLDELQRTITPPQSFLYATSELLELVRSQYAPAPRLTGAVPG